MANLGVPWEYSAWIYDSKTETPLTELPWSQIKWQRVKNKVSVGSAFIAEDDGGIECCGAIGGLRWWQHMLVVFRNQTAVWDGPILGWSRPSLTQPDAARGVWINAFDRFRLTMHRLISANRTWPSTFGNSVYTANLQQIMLDAGIGDINVDPYPFDVPRYNSGFNDDFIVDVGLSGDQIFFQNQAQAYDLRRELKVDRLESVFQVIDDTVTNGGLYYCMVGNKLHMNEMVIRAWLDEAHLSGNDTATTNYDLVARPRPILDDASTVDIPGIEVDGSSVATDYFLATAGQGENGFPQVGSGTIAGLSGLDCVLDLAVVSGSEYTDDPNLTVAENLARATHQLSVRAQYDAVEAATANFTIEQTRLGPGFGCDALHGDLSNLLPGVLIDIDTESTCAFNVPMSRIDYWYREFTGPLHNGAGYFLTPLIADAVRAAKLEQLDVTVSMTEDGLDEQVLASLTPWADWSGELPAGWLEPSYFTLGA